MVTSWSRAAAGPATQPGRTNREVAAELVISAKTVEHHLSRIYAKLGVRSRTDLAALLLGGDAAPGSLRPPAAPVP